MSSDTQKPRIEAPAKRAGGYEMNRSGPEASIDREFMLRAMRVGAEARCVAPPNPWVGCVIRCREQIFEGATREPGKAHAEIVALDRAGEEARGSTIYVTLEPCAHTGRTGPCVERIIAAGPERVVVGIQDPDARVAGQGISQLRAAGIQVDVGVCETKVRSQLRPYLHHRSTGRPFVILKLAMSLDGRTAAPDGTSQWITSPLARADGHKLRAESDAILVGAATIRRDNPSLTVRDWKPPRLPESGSVNPLRVVLGKAPEGARVHPCLELSGDLGAVLDTLGEQGVVQLLVEGGAGVAGEFHRAGLIDRYVFYVAPAIFGGDDARGLFNGPGAWSMADVWRGQIVGTDRFGPDLRIDVEPMAEGEADA